MDLNRKTAYEILLDVEKNDAYSNFAINHFVKKNEPDKEAFVRELVYGVLENTILKIPRSDVIVYLRTDWEVSKKLIEERGEKRDINETQEDYMELVNNFGSEIALRNNWNVINCCPDGQTMLSKDVISNAVLGFVLPHVS